MDFVSASANMIAVEIQRHSALSLICSLISLTSIVVLHSWQLGTASLVIKSYRLLQSVIRRPRLVSFKDSSGFDHLKAGLLINCHIHLIQLNLSKELDIA